MSKSFRNENRSYNKLWEDEFEWLMWKDNNAVCKWCDCVLKNMRKSAISDHEKSIKHGRNLYYMNNANMPRSTNSFEISNEEVVTGPTTNAYEKVNMSNIKIKYLPSIPTASYRAVNHRVRGPNVRSVAPHTDLIAMSDYKGNVLLRVSKPAPSFDATAVIDGQFKQVKLSDYLGKYLVFFFYPLDFTFVCPTEILAFNDRLQEFHNLNTEVLGCSTDSHFTHLAWTKAPRREGGLGKLGIPLLSDITHSIAKDYGVYLEDQGVALRGLFIIDDKGTLRQITMNDLPVGRSVDETLRLVQAFQFTDKHGEVCPAGWKPGDETIIPNPEEARKYFSRKAANDYL